MGNELGSDLGSGRLHMCFSCAGTNSIFIPYYQGTLPDRQAQRLRRVKLGPNRAQDWVEKMGYRTQPTGGKQNIQPLSKGRHSFRPGYILPVQGEEGLPGNR